ncbi:MAG: hypothetical protein RL323_2052 [Pseudomonadota bacterium]|jgi:Domain of unknown function (DUF4149)
MKSPVVLLYRVPVLLAGLWWGVVTGLAFVAVPLLFHSLGNPAVAGQVAAKLFSVVAGCSVAAGLVLLVLARFGRQRPLKAAVPWLLLAALAGLVQEWGVAEQIVTARQNGGNLRVWHGLGSVLVLLQWLCALRVFWVCAFNPATEQ